MSDDRPPITPDMKVAAFLKDYPELEDELVSIAPAFKKLRNPVLRRTVAKLTSLRQASKVGGVSLGAMISRLRVAAGQEDEWTEDADADGGAAAASTERPDWLDACGDDVETFDARESIEEGGHPLPQAQKATAALKPGQAYAIVTPFMPAPMIDRITAQGFRAWTDQRGPEHFVTYFTPNAD